MSDCSDPRCAQTQRRSLFGRMTGALAFGMGGFVPPVTRAQAAQRGDELNWPGMLKGTYHQVFDGVESKSGRVLTYASNFIASNPASAATSVVVVRDTAVVIALNSEIWAKYKIGDAFKFVDPETKEAAVKNPFLHPQSGVLGNDDWAIDRVIANGAIIGACNLAMAGLSRSLAHYAGVRAEEAHKEWVANVVPGVTVLPSGVWGVNRAQRVGCSYCFGT